MKQGAHMRVAALLVVGAALGLAALQRHAASRRFARAERCREEVFILSVLIREHIVTTGSLPGVDTAVEGTLVDLDPVALWRDLGFHLIPGDQRLFRSISVRDAKPVDPWGRAYWFRISDGQGRAPRVLLRFGSLGPDGHDDCGGGDDIARTVDFVPVPRPQGPPPPPGSVPAF